MFHSGRILEVCVRRYDWKRALLWEDSEIVKDLRQSIFGSTMIETSQGDMLSELMRTL